MVECWDVKAKLVVKGIDLLQMGCWVELGFIPKLNHLLYGQFTVQSILPALIFLSLIPVEVKAQIKVLVNYIMFVCILHICSVPFFMVEQLF